MSFPKRSPAVPNHDGTLALLDVSKHTFGNGTAKELVVMDIASGSFNTVAEGNEIHDANWLGDGSNAILFLKDGEKGATLIMVANANKPENPPYVAGEINGRVQAVRLKPLEDGNIAIAVVGLATPESGNLYNEVTAPQKASTGKIYTNFRVRLVRLPDTEGIVGSSTDNISSGPSIRRSKPIQSFTHCSSSRLTAGNLAHRSAM